MWLLIHAGIKVKTMLVKVGPGSRPPHFKTENILWDIEAIYTLNGQEGYFLLKHLSVVQIACGMPFRWLQTTSFIILHKYGTLLN